MNFEENVSIQKMEEMSMQQLERAQMQVTLQKVSMDMELAKADMFVQSGLLPTHINTKEKAFLIMQQGKELNVPPLVAFNNIAVINNKTTIGINLAQALIKRAGGTYRTISDLVPNQTGTDYKTEIEMTRNGVSETVRYTMSEAMIAGITTNGSWKKYPRQMMYARAFFLLGRRVFPDVLQGMYEHTEIDPTIASEVDNAGNVTYEIK